jgi:hypothetical protein
LNEAEELAALLRRVDELQAELAELAREHETDAAEIAALEKALEAYRK